MKLNIVKKPVIKAKAAAPQARTRMPVRFPRVAPKNGIPETKVDTKVTYVARRVKNALIIKETASHELPKCNVPMFLMVKGDKPGMLIHPVKASPDLHFYEREGHYGCIHAINSTGHEGLHAALLTKNEVMDRARKYKRPYEVTHVSTGKRYQVWLLNDFGSPYVAAVTKEGGRIKVLNIEHPTPHNTEAVRFNDGRPVKLDFDSFFGSIR